LADGAGGLTDASINELIPCWIRAIIIDGGNSILHRRHPHAKEWPAKGIDYVDVERRAAYGTRARYCMMIGGPDATVKRLDPIFNTLAPGMGDVARTPGRPENKGTAERGYLHCGPSGAGHFVKMVHNASSTHDGAYAKASAC